MSDFLKIQRALEDPSVLKPLTAEEVERLQRGHEGQLPDDYISFLRQVGWGNLGMLAIYAAPMDPVEVYTSARDLDSFVLFGDDMQGYTYAFDKTQSYRVVEIDPRGKVDRSIESGFSEFLHSFLLGG